MADDIHVHRLRRAWETADSIRAQALVVNTNDLQKLLGRYDELVRLFEDWQPTHLSDIELKEEAQAAIHA